MKKEMSIKRRGKRASKELVIDSKPKSDVKNSGFKVIEGRKSKNMMKRAVIIALLSAVFICIIIINSIAPTGIIEWIKVQTAISAGGEGFPIQISGSTAKNIYYQNNQLSVLTDTVIMSYNKSGNQIYNRLHGYANPVVKTSDIRTLIFDRGGSQYRIENASDTVHTANLDNNIITADISDKGTYAIATESEEDVALVTVYNKNNSPVYKYYSASYYVSSVSMSDDGKKLCVVTTSTTDAKLKSTLQIFDITKTDPIVTLDFTDEIIYLAEFVNAKDVTVLTSKRWESVDTNSKCKKYDFGSNTLVKYELSNNNGKTLLCLSSDSNAAQSTIVILNADGSTYGKFTVNGTVSSVSMYKNKIYVLLKELNTYSNDGKMLSSEKISSGAIAVKAFNKGAAVLYATEAVLYNK